LSVRGTEKLRMVPFDSLNDNVARSMASRGEGADFDNVCIEFVHAAIAILPSILERLIYLASLRDHETGEYHDQVLAALLALRGQQAIGVPCGKAELDRALRDEHLSVFEDWLSLTLRQQSAQLEFYASRQGVPSRTLSGDWILEKSYGRLAPSGAMEFQRRLFLADLEAVLTALSSGQTP
jgi:hypothetical protein